jgi:NAD(P)-dependent dehydrogenase (short-subunit alcohol dehydrogenase family)
MNLSTSRCLVTGASDPGSIGYACAVALLQAGAAHVTIAGRDSGKVQAAVVQLQAAHTTTNNTTTKTGKNQQQQAAAAATVHGVVADLSEPDQMVGLAQQAAAAMGENRIDILIVSGCNGGSEYLGLSSTDMDAYRLMHTISVLSPMLLTHAAIQSFHCASVVMISSMAANTPWPDTAHYNTAKAAQNCLVQQLAFQYRNTLVASKQMMASAAVSTVAPYAPTVRVNAVLAGCIHSVKLDVMADQKGVPVADYAQLRATCHPMGRNGTVEEVVQAALFLASPSCSSFVTGVLLPVDGGLHMSNWWNKPHMLAQYTGK